MTAPFVCGECHVCGQHVKIENEVRIGSHIDPITDRECPASGQRCAPCDEDFNLDSSVFADKDGTPYVLGELPDIPHKSTITITRPK